MMTDVRSLLRNERLSRRIEHPHAAYSSSGALSCTVCRVQLKADSLWDPHLRGKPHRQNLQRLQEAKPNDTITVPTRRAADTAIRSVSGGKKRKADDDEVEELEHDTHKKSKTTNGLPSRFFDGESNEEGLAAEEKEDRPQAQLEPEPEPAPQEKPPEPTAALPSDFFDTPTTAPSVPAQPATTSSIPAAPSIDESEYAAFEAAIATAASPSPPSTSQPAPTLPSALTAPSTISAPAISAEELAARAREEASTQGKGKREEEIEGEKEDAARALEEEFEEMERLEDRVRRLRQRREALREPGEEGEGMDEGEDGDGGQGSGIDEGGGEEEDSEDEEFDELTGWGMR